MELTGENTPDIRELRRADLFIVTPEKWDSISRGWRKRDYVSKVGLVILDEVHLLGVERGAVLVRGDSISVTLSLILCVGGIG